MDTKITYDVLSNDLIRKIKDIPKTTDTVSTNLTSWVPELIGSSGAILIYHIKDALLEEIRLELLHKFQEIKDCKLSVAYTLGSRLSYIQWHADHLHKFAITIYVNEYWDRNWSGSFVYQDDDERYISIYPEYNKAVSFTPPVWHASNMPTILAPLRESIQIFCD